MWRRGKATYESRRNQVVKLFWTNERNRAELKLLGQTANNEPIGGPMKQAFHRLRTWHSIAISMPTNMAWEVGGVIRGQRNQKHRGGGSQNYLEPLYLKYHAIWTPFQSRVIKLSLITTELDRRRGASPQTRWLMSSASGQERETPRT